MSVVIDLPQHKMLEYLCALHAPNKTNRHKNTHSPVKDTHPPMVDNTILKSSDKLNSATITTKTTVVMQQHKRKRSRSTAKKQQADTVERTKINVEQEQQPPPAKKVKHSDSHMDDSYPKIHQGDETKECVIQRKGRKHDILSEVVLPKVTKCVTDDVQFSPLSATPQVVQTSTTEAAAAVVPTKSKRHANKSKHHKQDNKSVQQWTNLTLPQEPFESFRKTFQITMENYEEMAFQMDSDVITRQNKIKSCMDKICVNNERLRNQIVDSKQFKQWIELQQSVANLLKEKIQNMRGVNRKKLQNSSNDNEKSSSHSYTHLQDAEIRVIFREVANIYRIRVFEKLVEWQQLYLKHPQQFSMEYWLYWLSVVVKSAQISISEFLDKKQLRCKVDTLLTKFKLYKLHILVVEMIIFAQLMMQYTNSTTNTFIPIGNGSSLIKQTKLQRQCHLDILNLCKKCVKFNSSDQKKVTNVVNHWFDKTIFNWTCVDNDNNQNNDNNNNNDDD